MGKGESHACVPKRNKYVGVPVCQLHYGVQARVPSIRDSRVAEANSILRGPWSVLTRALLLEPVILNKEVVMMLMMFKECPFYRASETLIMGKGIGYCDLDCDRTTCNGDVHLCEKPDVLKKHVMDQKRREKGNIHFSGTQGL